MDQLTTGWSKVRAWFSWLWHKIEEPRTHRFIWSLRYVVLSFVGAMALFWPPTSIAGVLPPEMVTVWGLALLIGGVIGAIFVFRRNWLIERVAVWLTGGGALLYLTSILFLHFTSEGNRLIQAGFVLLVVLALIDRYLEITGDVHEPGF